MEAPHQPNPYPKVRLVCEACGTDDVHVEGYATWSEDHQKFVLAELNATPQCTRCGSARTLFVPVSDVRHAAMIAAKKGE